MFCCHLCPYLILDFLTWSLFQLFFYFFQFSFTSNVRNLDIVFCNGDSWWFITLFSIHLVFIVLVPRNDLTCIQYPWSNSGYTYCKGNIVVSYILQSHATVVLVGTLFQTSIKLHPTSTKWDQINGIYESNDFFMLFIDIYGFIVWQTWLLSL
jgi:hypothetical protein